MIGAQGPAATATHLLPLAVQLAKDRVPNIRFNVAKVLTQWAESASAEVMQSVLKPCLLELQQVRMGGVLVMMIDNGVWLSGGEWVIRGKGGC
jgi:hypothetical protein